MIRFISQLNKAANRYAGSICCLGLGAVAIYNWRLWRRDRVLAEKLKAERACTPTLAQTPKVSALVAAWNEERHIQTHIDSFLALRYPDIELIVCAGGNDATLELAQGYASARVIVLEQRAGEGKQASLARCFEHASGEIIYLTDADCYFNDHALICVLAPIVNEGEQAATGSSRPLDEQLSSIFPLHLWTADTNSILHSPRYTQGLLGRNAAITLSAIHLIGGLGFHAKTGTDYHLARRLLAQSTNIRYVASSIVASAYPESALTYWRRQSRWMRNLLIYGFDYKAYHQVFDTVRTASVGAVMLMIPWITLLIGRYVLSLWIVLICHSVLSKFRYAVINADLNNQRLVLRHIFAGLPLTFFDFAVWISPLLEIVRRVDRERW